MHDNRPKPLTRDFDDIKPECYQNVANTPGTTMAVRCEIPECRLHQIRKALVLAKANAVCLLATVAVEDPTRQKLVVMDMYKEDIEQLSNLVLWMNKNFPERT